MRLFTSLRSPPSRLFSIKKQSGLSSHDYMRRHVNDSYVKKAQKMSYRSRAAFKLIDLDARYKFLKPGILAVDLGAAPGSWSQVLSDRLRSKPESPSIVAPIQGVRILQGDVTEPETIEDILEFFQFKKIDLVVSDMAPEFTGDKFIDHTESFRLSRSCLTASLKLLKRGGSLVVKVKQGPLQETLYHLFKHFFRKLQRVKPSASRKSSQEMYFFCEMFFLSEEPMMKRLRQLEEELQLARDDPLKKKLLETRKKQEMHFQLKEMVSEMHRQGVTFNEDGINEAMEAAKKNKKNKEVLETLQQLKESVEKTPLRDSNQFDQHVTKVFEELSGYTEVDEEKPLHVATEEFKHTLKRQEMIRQHKQKLRARGLDYESDDIDEEYEAMKKQVQIRRARQDYKETVLREKEEEQVKDQAYFEELKAKISEQLKEAQEEMAQYDDEAKLKLDQKKKAQQIFDEFVASNQNFQDVLMDKDFEEKLEYEQFKDDKNVHHRQSKAKSYILRDKTHRTREASGAGIMWDEDEDI